MKRLFLVFALVFLAAEACGQVVYEDAYIKVERIDSVEFFRMKACIDPPTFAPPTRITDPKEIERLLAPRGFKFRHYDDGDASMMYPSTGKFYKRLRQQLTEDGWIPEEVTELWFYIVSSSSSYYPYEDVFVEHNGLANSYNFRTGQTGTAVGEPATWLDSPTGLYRMSGLYSEYSGSDTFSLLRRIEGESYDHYPNYDEQADFGFILIDEAFWASDEVLFYVVYDLTNIVNGRAPLSFERLTIK